MIRFFVGGIPKSMKVGGVVRFQRDDKVHTVPKRGNSDWALLVGQIGREHAPAVPYADIPLSFTAVFYFPRPTSASKRVLAPLKRPDPDNCLHKLTDQFNGVFWTDDSQIIDLVARKRFATDSGPGVEIIVEPVYLEAERRPGPARGCAMSRSYVFQGAGRFGF